MGPDHFVYWEFAKIKFLKGHSLWWFCFFPLFYELSSQEQYLSVCIGKETLHKQNQQTIYIPWNSGCRGEQSYCKTASTCQPAFLLVKEQRSFDQLFCGRIGSGSLHRNLKLYILKAVLGSSDFFTVMLSNL